MFWGEYLHSIDKKGRLIIPARFRSHLCEGAFLTRGFDQNLVIYPHDSWQQLKERFNDIAILDAQGRSLRRLMFSGAFDITLDRQGRLLIPASLRNYAGLRGDALIVGIETFIEIWEPARWDDNLKNVSPHMTDMDRYSGIS